MGLLVRELKLLQLEKKAGKRDQAARKGGRQTESGSKGRNVRWHNEHLYAFIRKGHTFDSERDISAAYKNKALDESHLWVYKHRDTQVSRNEVTPLYEAVYRVADGRLFVAQKCHLAQVYARAGRTRAEDMWSLMPDGTPYWADRYLFRKLKQRSAKKRYEQKLK